MDTSTARAEDILEAVKPILKAHSLVLRLSDKPVIVDSWHYIEATATVESQDGATYTVTAYAREPEFKKGMERFADYRHSK